MQVPFLNLRAQHDPLRPALLNAFEQVLESSAFAGGKFVEQFEHEFAEFCHVSHAIGVGNGTDALWFALLALGVGPGDEVITTAATFMATAEAITVAGATPVFVDIDEDSYTMDPAQVESAITPRTRAIIPVHLYGRMADVDRIAAIARRHNLAVVEDACQAHGAVDQGRPAGSIGDAAAFSFYPGKNLGALGEAGAVTTRRSDVAARIRQLRDHGQVARYRHASIGWNGRMDGIQAAALRLKLPNLSRWNEARRRHAEAYERLLSDCEHVVTPRAPGQGCSSHHLYVLRLNGRDRVLDAMGRRGVTCGLHYPVPVHLQPAYSQLGYKRGALPVTENLCDTCLSLPLFPELTTEQVEYTATALKASIAECGVRPFVAVA